MDLALVVSARLRSVALSATALALVASLA